jgi:predicted kinase
MNTVITGPSASGKSTLAKELTAGRKSVWLQDLEGRFRYKDISTETEVIVVDEVADVRSAMDLMRATHLIINKQAEVSDFVKRPEVIVITQARRLEFLQEDPSVPISYVNLWP